MKIGDEIYVHGYIDEIRNGTIIIRNDGGYFGTVPSEIRTEGITKDQIMDYCKSEDLVVLPIETYKAIVKQIKPIKVNLTPDCPFCFRYGKDDCPKTECYHYKTFMKCKTCRYYNNNIHECFLDECHYDIDIDKLIGEINESRI